ncbi:hypothetical protein DFH06DRAFT_1328032 [Mycena polygramma]|nr:hypothetical protein DFH06DRAFT_1328032 [Mycena polygramma]
MNIEIVYLSTYRTARRCRVKAASVRAGRVIFSGPVFDKERQWSLGNKSYKLKPDGLRTLVATPLASTGSDASTVRLDTYHTHLFGENERAAIHFPPEMQDEVERLFLLMALLETQMRRQDAAAAGAAAGAA